MAAARTGAVDEFLAAARRQPVGLLIEGEAGIGKTTLLAGLVERAAGAGFAVLTAHTTAGEAGLAHSATADLLGAVDPDIVSALPDMQRLAADRVLQRAPGAGRPTDERVTAAAVLAAVQAVCAQTPVLIAVDDVQWLDPSSRMVLGFVARRLKGPVGVVVTERTGPSTGERAASWLQVGTGGLTRVQVDPMSLGALHSMLAARTGRRFSRPAIVRIAELSGGNPLYALELARVTDGDPSRPGLRLPSTLAELVRLRVGGLDDDVRDVLLAAASETLPTVDVVAATVGLSAEQVTRHLEAAEVEGVVVIEGNRVRFTHPLLAGGIYDSAPPARRREFHRRLAERNTQPELRARHLAMSATVADDATLAALDAAADSARSRGAPAAAAEFMELAIRLGGDKVSRRIRAAEHHHAAGETTRAAVLLDSVLDDLPPGVLRALALDLRAGVLIFDDDYAGAVTLLEQACADVVGHGAVHVSSLLMLAFAQGMMGAFADQLTVVARAVEVAEGTGVPSLISQALAMSVYVNCRAGRGVDGDALGRAIELEAVHEDVPIPFRGGTINGVTLAVAGRLPEADGQLTEIAERCLQRGAEHDVMAMAGLRAQVAIWRGRYEEADRHAADLLERAGQVGGSLVVATGVSAAVAAYRGRDTHARELAHRALELGAGQVPPTAWARSALAFLDVACGEHARAADVLAPLLPVHRPFAGTELMWCWFLPDAVEALIALGRHGEAEPMIEAFERNGARLDRPWQLAVGNRCRALHSAAGGDLEGALAAVERAMAQHGRLAMPFEQARSRLVMGDVQRRLRRRDAAARSVRAALAQFEELGVPVWADRARKELARINVADRSGGAALTDSEQRIAELVASGMTNKEVAETLYVSVKTVETNLTRVYRKLGIRSRSQLGARLGAPPEG
ncbi:AAA family ATPase [Mycobacterium sp. ITM-2016-00317]|uniref:helix-turn-helix transcriptional regulator n=1 Tax=Mycobacterium sp. ITM-2016-00317 TaxID=2099694 RepID=UPI00287F9D95|nr:AAA family ATPase [Mycobacterium sp. ITM-2016-00317]WNG87334.1 AAA family ATPase [Mycobacterium sp. ITM-2016-00317]